MDASRARGGKEVERRTATATSSVPSQVPSAAASVVPHAQHLQSYQFEFGQYEKQPIVLLDQVLRQDLGYVQWAMRRSSS